ncbi:MAG TPA: ECF-type sigma factor, partial [Gemmatimonadales bacterium]|nr:ECF-type sigma factor [Gemmatimonadales bacterium]
WQNRGHFFGIAAQAMRRILVDHARRRRARKRDAGRPVTLDEELAGQAAESGDLLAVDQALERLALLDARQARIVELRYFGGLSIEQTAEALEISPATVKRDWVSAKAWLQRELSEG